MTTTSSPAATYAASALEHAATAVPGTPKLTDGARAFIQSVKDAAPPVKGKGAKMATVAAAAAKGAKKVASKKTATKTATPAKKVAAKKADAGPKAPRGNSYKIVKKSLLPEKLSPQATFIIEFIEKNGASTKAVIAKAAEKAGQKHFPCNQPYDRAVGFYLSKFKGTGVLDFAVVKA